MRLLANADLKKAICNKTITLYYMSLGAHTELQNTMIPSPKECLLCPMIQIISLFVYSLKKVCYRQKGEDNLPYKAGF